MIEKIANDPIILVLIRYTLTAKGTPTLERASQVVDEYDAKKSLALHINLF